MQDIFFFKSSACLCYLSLLQVTTNYNGENPLTFTQVIVPKRKYRQTDAQQMDRPTDEWMDTWMTNVKP